MTQYRVTWQIDLDAPNPRKAAEKANDLMKNIAYQPVMVVQKVVKDTSLGKELGAVSAYDLSY